MENLKSELKKLLPRKSSKKWYAEHLNCTEGEIVALIKEIKEEASSVIQDCDNVYKHNHTTDVIEVSGVWPTIPTPEKIIERYSIDTKRYKLSNTWIKGHSKGHLVSVSFLPKTEKENFTEKFIEFLSTFKTDHKPFATLRNIHDKNACLILNMQDPHYNKQDVDGDNNMEYRFANVKSKVNKVLRKASISSNLEKIIYVIGADHFNSEFTDTTTKGTPQKNSASYQEGFKLICKHEIEMINMLAEYSDNIQILHGAGNHDEYVSWHMSHFLEMYYATDKRISFDSSPNYTKYVRFYNSAFCFNHGDAQKPEKLAQNFPIEFKDQWSLCNHFSIFTGDKHQVLSKSIGGIEFHQIPALSKAKSLWDKKNGYTTTPARLTAFLIDEREGMTDVYRELI